MNTASTPATRPTKHYRNATGHDVTIYTFNDINGTMTQELMEYTEVPVNILVYGNVSMHQ